MDSDQKWMTAASSASPRRLINDQSQDCGEFADSAVLWKTWIHAAFFANLRSTDHNNTC